MKIHRISALLLAAAAPVCAGPLDGMFSELPKPLEAASANQGYKVKVLPANPYRKTRGQAMRYTLKGGAEKLDWMVPLSNEKRPQEIRLSNAGHLITMDNFEASGEGPDVIQIYSPEGLLLKRYALNQLMSQKEYYERFQKPWFPPEWMKNSNDFFSADGKEWVLRTYWGQVYHFSLETGMFNAVFQGRYYVRAGKEEGQAELYTVRYENGKPVFTPCDKVVVSQGEIFSLQFSAKQAGGLALVQAPEETLKSMKSEYNAQADERTDLFLAVKRGTGPVRIDNPDARLKLSVRVDVQ